MSWDPLGLGRIQDHCLGRTLPSKGRWSNFFGCKKKKKTCTLQKKKNLLKRVKSKSSEKGKYRAKAKTMHKKQNQCRKAVTKCIKY